MILQSEENKGVEFTGSGNPGVRLGCETNEESKVKSPTLSKNRKHGPPKNFKLAPPARPEVALGIIVRATRPPDCSH
jgi:hypothetical protein